ncbi:MAG TPA: DUF167 domain-containing protein [Burkholderiales bacterium]|nr:DUF167 domain-containing protein [Burkholderiales bacterium]
MGRDSTWCRYDAAARRLKLSLHVQPNARRSEIAGLHGDALKIRIAAPAVDNKANTELIEFLSKTLEVSKSKIAIRRGGTSRRKVVEITGGPELAARLEALVASRITTHESRITPSTSR